MSWVTVTRDRHPLEGRRLAVLGQMHRHGRLELLVVLPDGSKTLLPAMWTDRDAAADGGKADGAGQAATLGSLADLLCASALASSLAARAAHQEQAARQSSCEEDHRAAHTVEFDAPAGAGATRRAGRAASPTADEGGGGAVGRPDRSGSRSQRGDQRRAGGRR